MAEREGREVVRVRQLWVDMVSIGCIVVRITRRTWCMISFKTSTGRSSSFSGPLAVFSFSLGAWLTGAGAADAPTAFGTARWLGQASSACFCVAIVCASSGEDESDWAMSSSKVSGDDALGLPGVESGEAMSLSSGWDHVTGG